MSIRFSSHAIRATAFAALLAACGMVFSEEHEESHSNGPVTAIGDAAITAKIKARYMQDTRMKDADISVSTVNGVVTLKGTAPDSETSNAAADLARNVDGVTSVENNIYTPSITKSIEDKTKVVAKKTGRVVSDSWITTKVKSVLLADSLTKGLEINVRTSHHVVFLKGSVGSQAAVDQAVHLASRIDGVVRVDSSELRVVAQ